MKKWLNLLFLSTFAAGLVMMEEINCDKLLIHWTHRDLLTAINRYTILSRATSHGAPWLRWPEDGRGGGKRRDSKPWGDWTPLFQAPADNPPLLRPPGHSNRERPYPGPRQYCVYSVLWQYHRGQNAVAPDQWFANPGISNPNPPLLPWIRIRMFFRSESESKSSLESLNPDLNPNPDSHITAPDFSSWGLDNFLRDSHNKNFKKTPI